MATTRSQLASAGASSTSALGAGGELSGPGANSNATEEWTGPGAPVRCLDYRWKFKHS